MPFGQLALTAAILTLLLAFATTLDGLLLAGLTFGIGLPVGYLLWRLRR
jgi:hypothetical protein